MPGGFEMDYDEGIAIYDEAIDKAEAEIISRGLPLSARPLNKDREFANFPEIPVDLSEVGLEVMQKLIGQFTAWFSYAISQLKSAEGQRNAAEKQRSFAWSSIRKLKAGTVADKDDAVRTDRRYIKIDAHYEHCDAKVRLYNGIVEGLKRDIETISRAVSVLEARKDVEGRSAVVGKRGQAAGESFRAARRNRPQVSGLDVFKKGRR